MKGVVQPQRACGPQIESGCIQQLLQNSLLKQFHTLPLQKSLNYNNCAVQQRFVTVIQRLGCIISVKLDIYILLWEWYSLLVVFKDRFLCEAWLELALYNRLASNSLTFFGLCLLSVGTKGGHHQLLVIFFNLCFSQIRVTDLIK